LWAVVGSTKPLESGPPHRGKVRELRRSDAAHLRNFAFRSHVIRNVDIKR
jgi:hypothetical protein